MRIGTIGAGEVAQAFAREALAGGHEIVLSNSSGPGALADKVTELGRGASASRPSTEVAASPADEFSKPAGRSPASTCLSRPDTRYRYGPRHRQPAHRSRSNFRSD